MTKHDGTTSLWSPVRGGAVLAVAALVMVAVAGAWTRSADALQAPKQTVLFNITSGKEDLHSVTMAMQLAGHALDDGRRVVLFLNVRAPEFARKDLPASFAFHGNPPVKQMLVDLMGRGAEVLVCPHCADVMGVGKEMLAEGVNLATRETLFAKLDANAVVFTY